MKSIAKNNSIFSKIKEDITSLLSFSDGSKYTSSEEEIPLPSELRSSLENLNLVAENYADNNILIIQQAKKSNSKSKTILNNIKPPVEKQKIENIKEKSDDKELEI